MSQTVLKPFHTYLFSVLRRIKQDCTFDQSSFLGKMDINKGPFYSMDLSNATDRFPIIAILDLLRAHFDESQMDCWREIMVGYPFNKGNNKTDSVTYNVGNPMGFYSSWASFTVAHHFVVYLACKRLKRD